MKKILLVAIIATSLASCTEDYANEKVKFKQSLQEKEFIKTNPNGTPKMVADSGYRPGPDGKPLFQATSKPRLQTYKGHDSTAHIYPPADLVKEWLGFERYYDQNILIAIACFVFAFLLLWFARKTTWVKASFMIITIPAAIFAGVGFANLTQKPFNIARENEKWMKIDDYRNELKKDSTLHSYWKQKFENGEILFTKSKSK